VSLRVVGGLAAALATACGAAYWASQTVLAPDPAPGPARAAQYVPAPPPHEVDPNVPAGQPLGPPRVDPAWLERTGDATGIPVPALRAYSRAQLESDADCVVGWTTLAGIGWVESQHGTLGGRTLRGDGTSSSRILGPALDGTGDVAALPATPDSETWHGDPRWEHAVGPMQFIPASWDTWGTDGDGDGSVDPHDLDDAAAAARRYLCAQQPDLGSRDGWEGAIYSYNHAWSYVASVHLAARGYAEDARG
jgi:membrane-bound lytic murein transglycosylase B